MSLAFIRRECISILYLIFRNNCRRDNNSWWSSGGRFGFRCMWGRGGSTCRSNQETEEKSVLLCHRLHNIWKIIALVYHSFGFQKMKNKARDGSLTAEEQICWQSPLKNCSRGMFCAWSTSRIRSSQIQRKLDWSSTQPCQPYMMCQIPKDFRREETATQS